MTFQMIASYRSYFSFPISVRNVVRLNRSMAWQVRDHFANDSPTRSLKSSFSTFWSESDSGMKMSAS